MKISVIIFHDVEERCGAQSRNRSKTWGIRNGSPSRSIASHFPFSSLFHCVSIFHLLATCQSQSLPWYDYKKNGSIQYYLGRLRANPAASIFLQWNYSGRGDPYGHPQDDATKLCSSLFSFLCLSCHCLSVPSNRCTYFSYLLSFNNSLCRELYTVQRYQDQIFPSNSSLSLFYSSIDPINHDC